MKKRIDPKTHGYRYTARPGDDGPRVLHTILCEAIKATAELASEGRSVDLGSLRTWDLAVPLVPGSRELGWEFDSAVIVEVGADA